MEDTEKKPASIFKLMIAFWIYDAVVAILLFFAPIALATDSDFGWWYLLYIYFRLLLIGAPILFGIWFGIKIGRRPYLPFRKKIGISFFIFIINCATYWIPILFVTEKPPWEFIPIITGLPALGFTVIFLISSILTTAISKLQSEES